VFGNCELMACDCSLFFYNPRLNMPVCSTNPFHHELLIAAISTVDTDFIIDLSFILVEFYLNFVLLGLVPQTKLLSVFSGDWPQKAFCFVAVHVFIF